MTTTRRQFMGRSAAALAGLTALGPSILKGGRRLVNPADAYLSALQHPKRKTPIFDDEIDFKRLAEWKRFCSENDLVYELLDDYSDKTVYDVLTEIATAGRATPCAWHKWGVVVDTGNQEPIQHLLSRTCRRVRVLPISELDRPDRIKWAQNRDNRHDFAYEIDLPLEVLIAPVGSRIFVTFDGPDGYDSRLDALLVRVEVINYPMVRITLLQW